MLTNSQIPAALLTFSKEVVKGKLHVLRSDSLNIADELKPVSLHKK